MSASDHRQGSRRRPCASLAFTATAAQAVQPYDHFPYDESDSFTTENCGTKVSVQTGAEPRGWFPG
jgi:hypothetical protein